MSTPRLGLWIAPPALALALAIAACDDSGDASAGADLGSGGVHRPGLGDAVAGGAPADDLALLDGPPPTDAGPDGPLVVTVGDIGHADSDAREIEPIDNACAKVDILVLVDNSGSMADNQASLAASFPGFVDKVRQRLNFSRSYHIGVVTSDQYWSNAPGCQDIGDLVTQTGGPESGMGVCGPFAEGHRFMTERDFDLLSAFSCAASVGSGGSDDERVMRGILNAVDPVRNGPGGCNEGFIRPDALLVIIILTDEDDVPDGCDEFDTCMSYGSGGTKFDWQAELAAARGGLESLESVVVLSILGRRGDNACGAVPAARLIGFTGLFGEQGYLGDICEASYDALFDEALPVLVDACTKGTSVP